MGAAVKGYNEHLAQVTQGLFTNLGIEAMLDLNTGDKAA